MDKITKNEMSTYTTSAKSGVEIIKKKLKEEIPPDLLNKFQIVCGGHINSIENLDNNKIRIYWSHLDTHQNEQGSKTLGINPTPLANGGWNNFHKIVFISNHQMENWINKYDIPRNHCTVIKYALEPVKLHKKPNDKIVLVYHSNPQRGLSILVNVFEKLCKEYSNLELRIHSSWKIYEDLNHPFLKDSPDWQKQYEESDLYKRLEQHPQIYNIGYVPNEELKRSLASSHIFAYPNIMVETFCLSLLEAMSAGCLCVHPNYGCLSETASNWTMMYDFHEDIEKHEKIFYKELKKAIKSFNQKETKEHLRKQKEYVDYLFNWDMRTKQWIDFLKDMEKYPLKKAKKISSLLY